MEDNNQGEKEYWWFFLKNIVEEKYHKGEPLKTIRGVKNKILKIEKDRFVVKSEKGDKNRPITKERIQRVLKIVISQGYYDVAEKDMSKACLNLNDGSNLRGSNTSIIRGLLINLPFIKEGKRATKIVLSPTDYDKAKWGLE